MSTTRSLPFPSPPTRTTPPANLSEPANETYNNRFDTIWNGPPPLWIAIWAVEAHLRPDPPEGRDGEIGPLQQTDKFVKDVNLILAAKPALSTLGGFPTDDSHARADLPYAIEMARIYLYHYGKQYERDTGQPISHKILARIYNGGPRGYLLDATLPYMIKLGHVLLKQRRLLEELSTLIVAHDYIKELGP